ncbi:uncharacterized protein ACRADG_013071 [Cochliomyia hominivorax]
MIKNIFSNLLIIILILRMLHTYAIERILKISSYEILATTPNVFAANSTFSDFRNSLKVNKNITSFNHPLPNYTPTENLLNEQNITGTNYFYRTNRSLLDENVKIHNDFHYEINKNNSNNNQTQQKRLLSNIKFINISTHLPLPLTSSSPQIITTTITKLRNPTASSSYFERVELQESVAHTKSEKLLLHRKKRYLLFPEGSSFQLVFDLIIPIVDYTNFAIMGITCAVAWELPSKPPSEIIENLQTKLNDGTFGISRRNDSTQQHLEYVYSQGAEKKTPGIGIINTYYQHYQPQISATAITTSGYENVLNNELNSPPDTFLRKSYYNKGYSHNQRNNFYQPTTKTFFYNLHPQQQQQKFHKYNFETIASNQRNMYEQEFNSQINKNYYPTHHLVNKWNAENWQHKQKLQYLTQKQHQETNIPYSDAEDYWNKNNWWQRNRNRIENHWQENQQKLSQYQEKERTGRKRKILNKTPKHHIYPIFGKRRRRRSYANHSNKLHNEYLMKKLEDIHTREHLQTRQKIFGKIEKLYKTRGQNGTACVLRAICETEKMHLNSHYNETPQSFVMELLRSIFALPKDTVINAKDSNLHLETRYINALLFAHEINQSCGEQYHDCEYSITYDICLSPKLNNKEKHKILNLYKEKGKVEINDIMKSNKHIILCFLVSCLLCSTVLCTITESAEIPLDQAIEQQLLKEHLQYKQHENIVSDQNIISPLKRKRRYLEFPEGSSFQLVYDLIVGVVDFTNYLILGVTVALAWELPSKPPSEIFEDFTERLKDGRLGTTRNDTFENIKYLDLKNKTPKLQPMFRPPMHFQFYPYRKSDSFNKYQSSAISQNIKYPKSNQIKNVYRYNNYYTPIQLHPFIKWANFKHEASLRGEKFPWWNLSERLKNSFINRPNNRKFDENIIHRNRIPVKTYKMLSDLGHSEHRIYPVFGKRSTRNKIVANKSNRCGIKTEQPTKMDRIHINHHRKSRHNLYRNIETYLNGRGSNGHHCVLRALCETGQKSNDSKPGSFVGELMRAIFTLPEPFDTISDYKEQVYDIAYSQKGECDSIYKLCKHSLWSSHFVF